MMSWSMHKTSKQLITCAIMEENPHYTEVDLKKELFLRFYRDDFNEEQQEKILKHLEEHSSNKRVLEGNRDGPTHLRVLLT
ncbi:MAG: hypothetical protein ACHQUC_09525 [Chlamydiales bacterium]